MPLVETRNIRAIRKSPCTVTLENGVRFDKSWLDCLPFLWCRPRRGEACSIRGQDIYDLNKNVMHYTHRLSSNKLMFANRDARSDLGLSHLNTLLGVASTWALTTRCSRRP